MARTEKKFGEVNAAPAATYSTLVPSSANRRNIIINATATAADNLHVVTSTGTIGSSSASNSVALSLATPSWAGGTFSSPTYTLDAVQVNPIGTRGMVTANNNNGSEIKYFTIAATTSNPVTFTDIGNGTNYQSTWGAAGSSHFYSFYSNVGSGEAIFPPGNSLVEHTTYTNTIKWASNNDNFVVSPTMNPNAVANINGYNPGVIAHGKHSTRFVACSPASGTSVSNYGLPAIVHNATTYYLDQGSMVKALHRFGAYYVAAIQFQYYVTTTTGTGVNTGVKMYSYSEDVTAPPTNFVGAIGYYNNLAMPIAENIANFGLADYNNVYGGFVCPSASVALTDPNMYYITVNSSGTTLTSGSPITAAAAGFRLVDNSKYATEFGLGYLTGVVTYPSAPTGVTVPATKFPTTSVKFSPNGKYIAVAYKRDYSGSGDTNSVVVVYTRQSNGTYSHTHSSGNKISYQPSHFDSMAWTPDSSGIITRSTDNKLYAWYPGLTPSSGGAYALTFANGAPSTPAFLPAVAASTSSSAYTAGNAANRSTGISFFTSLTGATYLWSYPAVTINTTATLTASTDHRGRVATINPTATVTSSNYVNTVANGIAIPANTVTQITGIVLEANERLEVDATTGSRLNVNAYGVEIS